MLRVGSDISLRCSIIIKIITEKKEKKIMKDNKLQKERIIAKLTCATCKNVLFGEGGEPGKVHRRET